MHAILSAGVAAGLVLAVPGTQATTLGPPPHGDLSSPNGIGAKLEPTAGDTPIVAAAASVVEAITAIVIGYPPWEAFYLNLYDPYHPKDLRFQGSAVFGEGPDQPSTSTLWVQFDWLDPSWGVIYSPAWGFPISWGTSAVVDASWTIAFCPEQVSLHLATDTPTGGSVNVAGQFTHECRLAPPPGVPEPSSLALVALGLLGVLMGRRPRMRGLEARQAFPPRGGAHDSLWLTAIPSRHGSAMTGRTLSTSGLSR